VRSVFVTFVFPLLLKLDPYWSVQGDLGGFSPATNQELETLRDSMKELEREKQELQERIYAKAENPALIENELKVRDRVFANDDGQIFR